MTVRLLTDVLEEKQAAIDNEVIWDFGRPDFLDETECMQTHIECVRVLRKLLDSI